MRALAAVIFATASAPALAAPVYLACTVQQGSGPIAVEITADEADQRAIVLLPGTGRVVTRKALFSPTEVNILDDETTWVVDRVSLNITRRFDLGDHHSAYPGKCAIKPAPPKRAF